MPIVTTLHTVLSAKNSAQRTVIEELGRLSDRLVVMSVSGAELLRRVHGIPDDQTISFPMGFRTSLAIPARQVEGTPRAIAMNLSRTVCCPGQTGPTHRVRLNVVETVGLEQRKKDVAEATATRGKTRSTNKAEFRPGGTS